jgi:hypothetical protein
VVHSYLKTRGESPSSQVLTEFFISGSMVPLRRRLPSLSLF